MPVDSKQSLREHYKEEDRGRRQGLLTYYVTHRGKEKERKRH